MNENTSKKWFTVIRNDCASKLASFRIKYEKIVRNKLENGMEFYAPSWIATEDAAEVELKVFDEIKSLEDEIKKYLRNKRIQISGKYPIKTFVTLWQILDRRDFIPKIVILDNRLRPPEYRSVANKINELNEIISNLDEVIKNISSLLEDGGKIWLIRYSKNERKLTINKNTLSVGTGKTRIDLFLRALCKRANYLLKNPVYIGDIYELGDDDIFIGKSKKEKQQYISNGYKELNDFVRELIPNRENLIIKDDKSFIINPKLK